MTMRRLTAVLMALATLAAPVAAQQRETLGWGRLLTNDFIGDRGDRWRTSSYALSVVRGPQWGGALPGGVGSLLEYRARAEIIAPGALNGANSTDRPYVGQLSFGLHTHWQQGPLEARAGVDLVAVGPQTGLDDLQDKFHDAIGQPQLGPNVIANQVDDAFYAQASSELSYPVMMAAGLELRPFVEAQYGVEDLVRIGADIRFGALGTNSMAIRDVVTGQRYRAISNEEYGWEFVAGGDVAYVGDSAYFPDSFGTAPKDMRWRARIGAHWQGGEDITFFYGATYLSEEYVGQPEGQVVGSMKLNFNF